MYLISPRVSAMSRSSLVAVATLSMVWLVCMWLVYRVRGQASSTSVKHVAVRPLTIRQAAIKQAEHVTTADAGMGAVAATPPSDGDCTGQRVERDLTGGVTDGSGVDREHGSVRLTVEFYHGKGSDPVDQISDGIGDLCSTAPLDGVASGGHHPHHTGFAPDLSESVSVADVSCPLTAVLVKDAPGSGLDSETVGHEVRSFDL